MASKKPMAKHVFNAQESRREGSKSKQRKSHVAQLKVLKWSKVLTQKGPNKRLESRQPALVHP